VLYLLADTSVWLDLAKNINGQKLIVTVRVLAHEGRLTLLVPSVVVDEFERKRKSFAASVSLARNPPWCPRHACGTQARADLRVFPCGGVNARGPGLSRWP